MKLVVAVDHSKSSERVFGWTLHDVCGPNDQLVALHIRHHSTALDEFAKEFFVPPELAPSMEKKDELSSRQLGEHFINQAKECQVACTAEIGRGNVKERLVEHVRHLQADVLVVGSKGRGMRRALLGGIGDYCLQHAECSVLLARDQACFEAPEGTEASVKERSPRSRLLVIAVDSSEASQLAFDWATKAVCRPEDRVIVLHVRPHFGPDLAENPLASDFAEFDAPKEVLKAQEAEANREAQELVGKFVKRGAQEQLQCEGDVVSNSSPGRAICDRVGVLCPTMLLMASSSGIDSRGVGSVTSYCAHNNPGPVLVVKPGRQGGEEPP